MSPIRISLPLLAWTLFSAVPAHAQATGVEVFAIFGGRILGAAEACSINADRIRRVSGRMVASVNARARSESERTSALDYFADARVASAEQFRSERSKCRQIHADFSQIEVKLGRAPGLDNDRVAAKHAIPPLGALPPEASATRKQ